MFPTTAYLQQQYLGKLDDPYGINFTVDVQQVALNEAYDALFATFLNEQCPRIIVEQQGIVLPALTTSITPATMGITNFADYEYLSERPLGSSNKFIDLFEVERLPQRPMDAYLRELDYRNGTFYFVGATQPLELKLRYETSGQAPSITSNSTIQVDAASTFLVNYMIGVSGERKGKTQLAASCMLQAVGPKYEQGVIGGDLRRLIAPLVRSRQHVPMAHKPFRAIPNYGLWRATPYIAAPAPASGSTNEYSTANGNITGALNGINAVFQVIAANVASVDVYRNGLRQTFGQDYVATGGVITFYPLSIPQTGDIVTADVTFGVIDPSLPPVPVYNVPPNQILFGTVLANLVNISDGTSVVMTNITVPGAQVGNGVQVAPLTTLPEGVYVVGAAVTAPNIVSFQLENLSGISQTIANVSFRATVTT